MHPLAWAVLKAYRGWFIAAPANDHARVELFEAVRKWSAEGFPLLEGEGGGSSPRHLRERATGAPVKKSAEKKSRRR